MTRRRTGFCSSVVGCRRQPRAGHAPVSRTRCGGSSRTRRVPALVADAQAVKVPVSSGARGLSRVRTTYRAPLLILMAGVGLLLLIICANVANILMARAVARTREMSVRLAIGAGRGRLVRQLLTESLLLAALGAGGRAGRVGLDESLPAGAGGRRRHRRFRSTPASGSPRWPSRRRWASWRSCAFGLMPALRASRVEVADAMRASGKGLTGSGMGQRNPLGRLLIASQVALSVILIVGATLLVRSLQHLQRIDTGIDRDRLLVVDVDAGARGYEDARLTALASELQARARAGCRASSALRSTRTASSPARSPRPTSACPGYEARQRSDSHFVLRPGRSRLREGDRCAPGPWPRLHRRRPRGHARRSSC